MRLSIVLLIMTLCSCFTENNSPLIGGQNCRELCAPKTVKILDTKKCECDEPAKITPEVTNER
jgi:hypothetical protein